MRASIPMYIASPLGFSEAGRYFYYEKLVPLVTETGFETLDPWKITDESIIEEAKKIPLGDAQRCAWIATNDIIGCNNVKAIQRSHIVLAVLDGPDVDSGTASEIGYAAGLGKPIIGYRNDFRLSSENIGAIVNIQVEYFIRKSSGSTICSSIEKLRNELIVWRNKLA